MDQLKLAQQFFNLSEDIYRLFYYNVFLHVCSAYSIIPDGFNVNKNPYIGKPRQKLVSDWQVLLNNVESKLRDLVLYEYVEKLFKSEETFNCLVLYEYVEKLFKSEETFNCLFGNFLIQNDWLLKVRGHSERYEKILRRRKLKKLRKLTKSNEFLYFECLGQVDSHEPFFCI